MDEFHLLHAKKLKSIIESQSNCDQHDTDEIAHWTHIGYIPWAHPANAQSRPFRRSMRNRIKRAQRIPSIKNQIHAILSVNIFYSDKPTGFKSLFCQRGLRYLKEVPLPEPERFVIDPLLEHMTYLNKLKETFEGHIQQIPFVCAQRPYWQSVPARNGRVLNDTVLAEINGIEHFKNSEALGAYAGLIP